LREEKWRLCGRGGEGGASRAVSEGVSVYPCNRKKWGDAPRKRKGGNAVVQSVEPLKPLEKGKVFPSAGVGRERPLLIRKKKKAA